MPRWFSQRVGWYHGLIKVYIERFSEVLRVSRRSPFAAYHYLIYVGGLSLAMHLVKIVSAAFLLLSFLGGLDALLLDNFVPHGTLGNPDYFTAAIGSYLALGVIALFHQRAGSGASLYGAHRSVVLCYAIVHIVPMTVGFGNFFALRLFRRRIYQDHYESPADPACHCGKRGDGRMTVRGIPAPELYKPGALLGGSRAAIRGRRRRAGGGVRVRNAGILQSCDSPGATAGARAMAESERRDPRIGRWVRRRALEPIAGRARRRRVGRGLESDHDRPGPTACGGGRCCRTAAASPCGIWPTLDVGERFDLVLGVTVLQHILDPWLLRAALAAMTAHLAAGRTHGAARGGAGRAVNRCDSTVFRARHRDVYLDADPRLRSGCCER